MTEEEQKAIENFDKRLTIEKYTKNIGTPIYIKDIEIILNLINKQQKEIETSKQKEKFYKKLSEDNDYFATELENKNQLEKEVADDIDKVAVELSKLSDNIYIVNQAMLLQKIAQEKLGKFYID